MASEPLALVQAIADIIGNTGDEERAAVLANAWGETRFRDGQEEMRERAAGVNDRFAESCGDDRVAACFENEAENIRALPVHSGNEVSDGE